MSNQANWNNHIAELENYFKNSKPPTKAKLNECAFIVDSGKFLESHFAIVKANNGKQNLPYLNRLKEFKTLIINLKTEQK